MPHKTKKKFIDKNKSVTFQLVHRSQKDPLAADDEAPQRVLVPVSETNEHGFDQETAEEREMRMSKQRLYGVGFDDDYDYMQHLRQPEKEENILIRKDSRISVHDLPPDEEFGDLDELTEVLKDQGQSASIKLPSVVFASKDEEEIGMLHRAIPPVGPQVDWDPDIVAAMDEDFDMEDQENILDDDFILQAAGDEENEMEEEDCDSDVQSLGSMEDEFSEEETRSRFTQYSMTSSVVPRNEHLTLLDDKFEKFYEMYDDEKIGDLGQIEIDGAVPVDNISEKQAMLMLLGIDDKVQSTISQEKCPKLEENQEEEDDFSHSEESDEGEYMVELVKNDHKEKWDCESIISTYSNIYNHPKMIENIPKPIKLSKKTGIPLDTLPTRGLTKAKLQVLDKETESSHSFDRTHTVSECSQISGIAPNVRSKDETKEEKKARKQAVREMRKERRAEKKSTKVAFKVEKNRQNKELINLQHNLNGIRIS